MANNQNKGLARIVKAFFNSIDGFKYSFKNEEAFRQEIFLFIILFPLSFIVGKDKIEILFLISGLFAVLMAELINTAIECVIDRISLEIHELSKAAKDIGSTIVLLALFYCVFIWGFILIF